MTAPQDDTPPRPDLTSDFVIVRAVLQIEEALMDWVSRRLTLRIKKEEAVALAASAIRETGADGFRAATHLLGCGWPADFELCQVLQRACDQLPFCRRLCVDAWVMAHAVRFPAVPGDVVQWRAAGKERRGVVETLIQRDASAVVRPLVGTALAGEPVRIVAEQITSPRLRIVPKK